MSSFKNTGIDSCVYQNFSESDGIWKKQVELWQKFGHKTWLNGAFECDIFHMCKVKCKNLNQN